MALAAHERAFFLLLVTLLAVAVKGLHQSGLFTGRFQIMAVRATLVFRRFVLHEIAVIIVDMVALIAFFDLRDFIVFIMLENSRRSLRVVKGRVVDKHHIFL
jgi:hypothetical protein